MLSRFLSGGVRGFKPLSEHAKAPSFLSYETGFASRRKARMTCAPAKNTRHATIPRILLSMLRIVATVKLAAPRVFAEPQGVLIVQISHLESSNPTVHFLQLQVPNNLPAACPWQLGCCHGTESRQKILLTRQASCTAHGSAGIRYFSTLSRSYRVSLAKNLRCIGPCFYRDPEAGCPGACKSRLILCVHSVVAANITIKLSRGSTVGGLCAAARSAITYLLGSGLTFTEKPHKSDTERMEENQCTQICRRVSTRLQTHESQ